MKQILVAENEFIIAQNIKNKLSKLGYVVTTGITESSEIMNSVRRNHYDLILMNVRLQGDLDGIEIMNEIRTFSSIPVIYITSVTDKLTRKRAERTAPAGFLKKPFEYDDLIEVIEQAMQRI
ncbi:MAG: response regulator [Balneolales bacterium]